MLKKKSHKNLNKTTKINSNNTEKKQKQSKDKEYINKSIIK